MRSAGTPKKQTLSDAALAVTMSQLITPRSGRTPRSALRASNAGSIVSPPTEARRSDAAPRRSRTSFVAVPEAALSWEIPPLDYSFCDLADLSDLGKVPPRSGQKTRPPTPEKPAGQPGPGSNPAAGKALAIAGTVSWAAKAFRRLPHAHSDDHDRYSDDEDSTSGARLGSLPGDASPRAQTTFPFTAHTVRLNNNSLRTGSGLAPALHRVLDVRLVVSIDLSSNLLASFPQEDDLRQLVSLRFLYLHNNKLADATELTRLQRLPSLTSLTLHNNPLQAQIRYYRHFVLVALPRLLRFDFVNITPGERQKHPDFLLPQLPLVPLPPMGTLAKRSLSGHAASLH
eukprot:TRINITY_DN5738_c0_g1_i1.p1 TRINITY_DN5738_c0_g1~~TRINITY_DN5738_c0_g1_i1.p1  ORF type:complete len:343 (-),score=28.36 TRINITY_DN5738_c0_g1_i1:22-1050(-)